MVLACLFLALAAIGLVLPLIPTVPFLLVAAWFAARGSKRLDRWMHEQPYFGKVLKDWETDGAVSRKSKVLAVSMMLVSWIFALCYASVWAIGAISIVFICVISFLITRPEPRS